MRQEGQISQGAQAVSNEFLSTLDLISAYGRRQDAAPQELLDKRDRLSSMDSILSRVVYLLTQRNPMEAEGAKAALNYVCGKESEISGFVQNMTGEPQNG